MVADLQVLRAIAALFAAGWAAGRRRHPPRHTWEINMLDAILVAVGIGFFAVATLYVTACDHL
ncbi:MAG: hypothetical protein ACREDL_17315 [Bradyrhizobium sp.]